MNKVYCIKVKDTNKLLRDINVKCKHCGHSIYIGRCERIICSHCGKFVYKNRKIAFKYELKKRLKY